MLWAMPVAIELPITPCARLPPGWLDADGGQLKYGCYLRRYMSRRRATLPDDRQPTSNYFRRILPRRLSNHDRYDDADSILADGSMQEAGRPSGRYLYRD